MNKVWIVNLSEPLPTDVGARRLRAGMVAKELSKNGYCVTWFTSQFNHLRKRWYSDAEMPSCSGGVNFVYMKGIPYSKNISVRRFIDHRIIAYKFRKIIRNMELPDLIIVSTPPYDLAYECSLFARKNSIRLVTDVRDQWPDSFLHVTSRVPSFIRKIFVFHERKKLTSLLQSSDAIFSMSTDLLTWAISLIRRDKRSVDQVFHLSYDSSTRVSTVNSIREFLRGGDSFVVSFVGTLSQFHDPTVMIESAKLLGTTNIKFIIAGTGQLLPALQRECAGLKNVLLTGYLNSDEINYLMSVSNCGVCSTSVGQKHRFFPNKSFLYMSFGLPILNTFAGELANYINEYGIGYNYFSTNEFVDHVLTIANDPVCFNDMSHKSKRIFKEIFSPEVVYSKYIRAATSLE